MDLSFAQHGSLSFDEFCAWFIAQENLKRCGFAPKNTVKNVDFALYNVASLLNNSDFALKNGDSPLNNDDFNDEM